MRRASLLLGPIAACLVLWALLPVGSDGATGRSLQEKIQTTQRQIGAKKGTEQVLSTQVAAYTRKIGALGGRISVLQRRQAGAQADLDRATAELTGVQDDLRMQRARQVRLTARLAVARRALAQRLRERYMADKPDLLSVVLNAKGFAALLEQADFLRRIGAQDTRIITAVRDGKAQADANAARLAVLEKRAGAVAARIKARRDQIAALAQPLLDARSGYRRQQDGKAAILARVRSDRHRLEGDLADLKAEQARIAGVLTAPTGAPSGPAAQGTGQLTWPVNGPITSPFCERRAWESCHPGIDIGVPSGTPIHAADSGRVAFAGPNGGYGNFTCVQHTSALSTCYAHQSSIGVSVGQNVRKGQVIGLSGCTGLCFGAHLHFEVRINGRVTNPLDYL